MGLWSAYDISIQFSTLNNPYDHEKKITNSESNRLQNHSTEIKDYLDKLESYKILLTSDKLSLYSQLNKLLISFIKGGKHGTEGGSEKLSATNAQLALTNFLEYWNELSTNSKTEALKIQKFKLFMDKIPKKNQNEAQSYCVEADGADKIAPILQENTSELNAITISKDNQSEMVKQRKNECASAHKQIIDSIINTYSYKGSEPLGTPLGLMMKYNVNLNITDIKTLIDFVKKLDINSLDEYLKEYDIKSQIKKLISNLENIFGLADLAADKFKKLIEVVDICKVCNAQERLFLINIMPTKEHKLIVLEKSELEIVCLFDSKSAPNIVKLLSNDPELQKHFLTTLANYEPINDMCVLNRDLLQTVIIELQREPELQKHFLTALINNKEFKCSCAMNRQLLLSIIPKLKDEHELQKQLLTDIDDNNALNADVTNLFFNFDNQDQKIKQKESGIS